MTFKYLKFQKNPLPNEKKLLESIDLSFDKVKLYGLLKKKIKIKKSEIIISKQIFQISKNRKIYVVAFGKMANRMIACAYKLFYNIKNVKYFLISNKIEKSISKKIISYRSQHPVPGKLALKATKKLVEFLKKTEKNSILIFLVSGGGSSMLAYPIRGVSINEKIRLTKKLFSLNTEPKYLNYFRMALSRVKNGGLLRDIKTNHIFNFFVSDENEDKIEILSSGPTVNRQAQLRKKILNFLSKNKYARKLIGKKNYFEINKNLNFNKTNKRTYNSILLKNFDFIKILKKEIQTKQKVDILVSKKFYFGDYEKNLKKIEKILNFVDEKKKKIIYIFGCQIETPMEAKSEKKLGGRLQHITAELLIRSNFKNVKIVSIATDGQDYNSNVFGTLIDFSKKYNKKKISSYIKKKNTKNFHIKNKSLITSKKNINLNLKDIVIIYNFS